VNDLHVRAADPSDVAAILELFPTDSDSATRAVHHWVDSGSTRVCEQQGKLVGFAVTEATFFGHEFVEMLRVAPSARRMGAGSLLLSVISSERATSKLFTSTNLSNTPMQTLLKGLSWSSAGIVYGLDDDDPELFYAAPRLPSLA